MSSLLWNMYMPAFIKEYTSTVRFSALSTSLPIIGVSCLTVMLITSLILWSRLTDLDQGLFMCACVGKHTEYANLSQHLVLYVHAHILL